MHTEGENEQKILPTCLRRVWPFNLRLKTSNLEKNPTARLCQSHEAPALASELMGQWLKHKARNTPARKEYQHD